MLLSPLGTTPWPELPDAGDGLAPRSLCDRQPDQNPGNQFQTRAPGSRAYRVPDPDANRFLGRNSNFHSQAKKSDAGNVGQHRQRFFQLREEALLSESVPSPANLVWKKRILREVRQQDPTHFAGAPTLLARWRGQPAC